MLDPTSSRVLQNVEVVTGSLKLRSTQKDHKTTTILVSVL